MAGKYTLTATDEKFQSEVLSASGVALVDFWAEWCGPCKALGPVVDELAEEFQGKARVFKLDVDANPSVASSFQIRGIPTLLVFKDGKLVDRVVGAVPKEVIQEAIERNLG